LPLAPILRRLLRDPAPPPPAAAVLAAVEAADTRPRGSPRIANAALVAPLTGRELDVLRCLARRLTNDEIGAELFISPITAKHHVANISGKLAVSGRRAAVARATELGLLG
jgi:ATP/maltotriose-dependent transcriptional regulator MalT